MFAPEPAALMQFLAPGFLHTFGNALFSIQGHGQLLQMPQSDLVRNQEGVLHGCGRARAALDLFRLLMEQRGKIEPGSLGPVLEDSHDVFRVSLREAGLSLKSVELAAPDRDLLVDRRSLFRALGSVLYGICAHLPTGYSGELHWIIQPEPTAGELVFSFALQPDGRQLPFQVELEVLQGCLPDCPQVRGMEFPAPDRCELRFAQLPRDFGAQAL